MRMRMRMRQSHTAISRKRPSPHQASPQPSSKRRKHAHPRKDEIPAAFWDNLSKIDLTKRALRELDRRTSLASHSNRLPSQKSFAATQSDSYQSLISQLGEEDLQRIKQSSRHGGPNLAGLRGFLEPPELNTKMSLSGSNSQTAKRKSGSASNIKPSTNTSKSTGPYNPNFGQKLIDGGIFPPAYRNPDGLALPKPNNWAEIEQRLSQRRPSLSASPVSDKELEEVFQQFVRADADAVDEQQVTGSVLPIVEGKKQDARCTSGGNAFANLEHLTDGSLVPGNPDIYHGARPEQLKLCIRNELSEYIIPTTESSRPLVPNFFVAVKGRKGTMGVASLQATYDGALGARGMSRLQSYSSDEPLYDNNASVLSCIYYGGSGMLKIYTVHPVKPHKTNERPQYVMHQLKGFDLTSDLETFRLGLTYYRNGRDWAKEQRDAAIAHANSIVEQSQITDCAANASQPSINSNSEAPSDIAGLLTEDPVPSRSSSATVESPVPLVSVDKTPKDFISPGKRPASSPKQSSHLFRKRIDTRAFDGGET